jgi:CheY-like chemotaxis protein
MSNAVQFTDHGYVHVTINSYLIEDEKWIDIDVQDSGIGIDIQHIDKIFDSFYQVDSNLSRRHEGLGLGLAISKNLSINLKGKILVDTKLGQGSNFLLSFPVKHAPDPAHQEISCLVFDELNCLSPYLKEDWRSCTSMNNFQSDYLRHSDTIQTAIFAINSSLSVFLEKYETLFSDQNTHHVHWILITNKPITNHYLRLKKNQCSLILDTQQLAFYFKRFDFSFLQKGECWTCNDLYFHTKHESVDEWKQKKLLFVDDHEGDLNFVEKILSKMGCHQTKFLSNPNLALEAIKTWKPDVIVLDLHMKPLSGYDLCFEIRKIIEFYHHPILLFTADSPPLIRDKCQRIQVTDIISKPFIKSVVAEKLRRFITLSEQID